MSVLKKILIKDLRGSFKYHIFIGRNILYKLNDDFKKQIKNKNVFLLYDDFFNPINKVDNPYLIAADSMNLWIDLFPQDVIELIKKGSFNKKI